MRTEAKQEKLKELVILSVLALLAINIPLISAYFVITNIGSFTLYPGEDYTLNIPFIGNSEYLTDICGKAVHENGSYLSGINVSLYYSNGTLFGKNTTKSNGKFCFSLDISSNKQFDIDVEYNNSTMILGNNDYDLNFEDNEDYSRNSEVYAILSGNITNYDAEVENGRIETNLQYWPENASERYVVFDYINYNVSITPNNYYRVPSSNFNVSWPINSSTTLGRYKFYIKSSFNGQEHTKSIYFNITN